MDPDLREYRRTQALTALADRYSPKKPAPPTTKTRRKPRNERPLFAPDAEDDPLPSAAPANEEDADPELAAAIQESLETAEEASLRRAVEASRAEAAVPPRVSENGASSSKVTLDDEQLHPRPGRLPAYLEDEDDDGEDDNMYASPSRLETALSIAGAGPARRPLSEARRTSGTNPFPHSAVFGTPSLLLPETGSASAPSATMATPITVPSDEEEDEDMEEVLVVPSTPPRVARPRAPSPPREAVLVDDEDEDMEEVSVLPQFSRKVEQPVRRAPAPVLPSRTSPSPSPPLVLEERLPDSPPQVAIPAPHHEPAEADILETPPHSPMQDTSASPLGQEDKSAEVPETRHSSDNEDEAVPWDRLPSPQPGGSSSKPVAVPSTADGWDAADEMDPHAEEGEFARFISQVRGKDIESVRREIDDEIRELHQQRKAALRDSEDITQQMISQIMVSTFPTPHPSSRASDRLTGTHVDHAAPVRHPVHHRADGGGGAVRGARAARARRRDHHGRLGRVPLRRPPRAEEHVQPV